MSKIKLVIRVLFFFCFISGIELNAQVEVVSSGTGAAYEVNVPAIFPLRNGVQVTFKSHALSVASPTINVTGTGAILIKKEGGSANLAAGDIKPGQVVTLAYDGTFWQMLSASGNPSSSGSVTGTGTQNHVTKWNNAGGTTLGNSNIFDDGTFVGIGTSTPTTQFHLRGSSDPLQMMIENAGNNFTTGYTIKTALNEWFIGQEGNSVNGFRINDVDVGLTRFQIDPNGNVGIGTTSPTYLLDVMGRGHFFNGIESSGTINIGNSGSYQTFVAAEFGGLGAGLNLQANGIGGHSYTMYSTNAGDGVAGLLKFTDETTGLDRMVIDANGRLGIGTTTPSSALSVGPASQFQVNSSGNIVRINNVTTSFPAVQGAASTVLQNDGAGNLSWVAPSSSLRWDQLTAPTANLTLAHGANTTLFSFNGVTSNNAFTLSSNSLATGTLLHLSSSSNTGTGGASSKVLNIVRIGANTNPSHIAYGVFSSVSNTGTTNTNIAGYFNASGATNNYGIIVPSGNVGIGTSSPASPLHVIGNAQFGAPTSSNGSQIWNNASNANTVTINSGITTTSYTLTLPTVQGGANTYLTNNGTGGLSWTSAAAGVTTVSASAPLSSTGGVNPNISLSGIVPIANGGTNNSTPYTSGSVIFSNGTSLTQNNPSFFWDNTNTRLGIGTSAPAAKLHVAGTNPSSIINQVAENSTQSIQSGIITMRSRGTVAIPTVIGSGDQLGGFYMMGYDGTSFGTNGPAAGISAIAAQSFSGGTGTDMFFSTSNINATSASTKMIITANGNVGIGTSTNPNQKLEIQDGNILLSNTATQSELRFKEANANGGQFVSFKAPAALASNVDYTLPIDAGTANAVLSTDGTGTLSWQNVSGTLSGGSLNYLPKWTSANTLSSTSLVYDNGTNIGIGTNAPGEKLQIVNNAVAGDNAAVSILGGSAGKASYYFGSSVNNYSGAIQYDNNNNSMNFWTNNTTNRLVINNSGNIGIGTATPTTRIHSRGDLQIEDISNSAVVFNMATLGDGVNPVNGTGTKGWQWLAYGNAFGTAALQNDMRLTWYNGTGTAPFLYFDNTGKLGVNLPLTTDQPLYDLDVAGTIRSGYNGRDGQLRIYSEQGATDMEISFSPPATMTQTTAYLLPPNDGNANDVLTSNGTGTLTWSPVSALGISGTGTTNFAARWISGTQLSTGVIQDDGVNAGIGVVPGFGKLDVAGEILSIDGTSGQAFTIRRSNLHRWSVKETGTAGLQFIQFYNDAGVNQNVSRFDIADNGNIGIGTSTPAELLELSSIDSDVDVETYSASESSSLHVKRARGTSTTPAVPLSGDYFGGMGFQAWDGVSFKEGARVQGAIDGSAAANDMPGRLEFWTSADGTASAVERMRISNTGNVGIGTSTPGSSRLNVFIPSTDALNPIGLTVTNNYTGASIKYGIDVNVDGAGSGTKYGISSSVVGLSGDASANYGYQVLMTPNGTGTTYGLYSSILGVGTGAKYGIYNSLSTSSTNASVVYGSYTSAYKPSGASNTLYGSYTFTQNDGSGTSYGLYSNNTGAGATRYGVYVTGETDNYFSNNVGIGTATSPAYPLEIQKNQSAYLAHFNNTNGLAGADGIIVTLSQTTPDATAYYLGCYSGGGGLDGGVRGDGANGVGFVNLSDGRLKQNVKDFSNTLSIIDQIAPKEYEMIRSPGIKRYGFIAQELQKVYPMAVFGSSDSDVKTDPMGIDYARLTPLLTGGIKELHQIVKTQDQKIKTLEQELAELKRVVDQLQKK
jgi:hypothetical protein